MDRKEGHGTYFYANGMIHVGAYESGQPNGYGKMTNSDGSIFFEGEWLNGQPAR